MFSGDIDLVSGEPYTISFNTPFEWEGNNIIVTVFDSTGIKNSSLIEDPTRKGNVAPGQTEMFATPGKVRFLHKTYNASASFASAGWEMDNLTAAKANSSSVDNRKYVNKITFTFDPAPATAPATPDDLAVSSVTANSATLSWSAVEGATSYELQQSADNSNWSELASGIAGTSYTWSELSAQSTQYVRIRAVNANGESDWSDAITVTTDATHEHNGITFSKWNSTNSLPTSGNYYLANDIELGANASITGDLNLCLNGHSVYTETNSIQVQYGATLAIYDNIGTGSIYGYFVADYPNYGVINVEIGGTLIFSEGSVRNLYGTDPSDTPNSSYAIYNFGTLKLSGAPVISGKDADIYLGVGKVITIESEKPLTNTVPFSVFKSGAGAVTSGWANMNGADPRDYLISANNSLFLTMGASEAEMINIIPLSEKANNTAIATYESQLINVSLTRSLTSAQYNTFCLPFALDDDQLQEFFGTDYDLQELTASSLTGETLNLEFTKCTALEAGKPYLLQPSVNVTNPVVFEGVTITATSPGTSSTTYVDYQAVYSPTSLAGGNRNLLFLGADNELFWPKSTGNLNGFRAYFEIKGAAQKAAKRARISMGGKIATGIENPSPALPQEEGVKILRDGKLYLMYKGQMYDVQGKRM